MMSIKFPSKMLGSLAYVESVAKVMAVTSTPSCKSRCLGIHSFVDDIAVKFDDVERCFVDSEGVIEDTYSHDGFYLD